MSIEERVSRVEEAILILRDLNLNHNERLDDYFRALRESREDFEFKMNAVIDAQMQNEADIRGLKDSIIEVKDSIIEMRVSIGGLAEASKSQLKRIENLENK